MLTPNRLMARFGNWSGVRNLRIRAEILWRYGEAED